MIRLFRVFIPVSVLGLIVSEAALILACFMAAASMVAVTDLNTFLFRNGGWLRIGVGTSSIMFALHFQDLYTRIRAASRFLLAQQLILVIGVAFLTQAFVSYLRPAWRVPLPVMLVGSGLAILSIFAWRVLYGNYVLRVVGRQRLLFVGSNALVLDVAHHIAEHSDLGFEVIGYVDDSYHRGTAMPGGKVLGPMHTLREVAYATRPGRIVIGLTERRGRMPVADLLDLRFAGFVIEEAGQTFETVCGRISTKELRPSQLIFSGELGPRRFRLAIQSVFNLIVASIALAALAPVMLLTALAVRLSGPGPVLFRQTRVGRFGRPFTIFKFRSMVDDAEKATGAVWAVRNDPRITPLGRFLRKSRLDELPQLFNVLRGEMSIVGPRPERPEFVRTLAEKIVYYGQRHAVKPGITGWAQINYKYGDTIEDTIRKLEYDLYYIKNMSPGLDTFIIFHTVKTMLLSRGAQ